MPSPPSPDPARNTGGKPDLLCVIRGKSKENEDTDVAYDHLKLSQIDEHGQQPEYNQENQSAHQEVADTAEIRIGTYPITAITPKKMEVCAKYQNQINHIVHEKVSRKNNAV